MYEYHSVVSYSYVHNLFDYTRNIAKIAINMKRSEVAADDLYQYVMYGYCTIRE